MRRRSLFGVLLGSAAVAAEDPVCPPTAPAWECGKAKNGQCPVCARVSLDRQGFNLWKLQEARAVEAKIVICSHCQTVFGVPEQ